MSSEPDIALLAAAITEPARAAILVHLLDGRSWTATELKDAAGIRASTASAHLQKLLSCGLIKVSPSGRHRYFRLANVEIAKLVELLQCFAPARPPVTPGERRCSAALRKCRMCYDHLAGRLGVAIAETMVQNQWLTEEEPWFRLTDAGAAALSRLSIAPSAGRTCTDWSERKFHLAGALGARLAQCFLERRFVVRVQAGRALRITAAGWEALERDFGFSKWTLERLGT